jgi:hypothetical protein
MKQQEGKSPTDYILILKNSIQTKGKEEKKRERKKQKTGETSSTNYWTTMIS